jgi:hypothetical protein
MSVASMVRGWVRSERAEVVVVERPVKLYEYEFSDEWTVEGTVQLLIANGYDEKEIAEFKRDCAKR